MQNARHACICRLNASWMFNNFPAREPIHAEVHPELGATVRIIDSRKCRDNGMDDDPCVLAFDQPLVIGLAALHSFTPAIVNVTCPNFGNSQTSLHRVLLHMHDGRRTCGTDTACVDRTILGFGSRRTCPDDLCQERLFVVFGDASRPLHEEGVVYLRAARRMGLKLQLRTCCFGPALQPGMPGSEFRS